MKFRHFIYITRMAREWLGMIQPQLWDDVADDLQSLGMHIAKSLVAQKVHIKIASLDVHSPSMHSTFATPRPRLILVAHGVQFLGDVVCPSGGDVKGPRRHKHGLSGRWNNSCFAAGKWRKHHP